MMMMSLLLRPSFLLISTVLASQTALAFSASQRQCLSSFKPRNRSATTGRTSSALSPFPSPKQASNRHRNFAKSMSTEETQDVGSTRKMNTTAKDGSSHSVLRGRAGNLYRISKKNVPSKANSPPAPTKSSASKIPFYKQIDEIAFCTYLCNVLAVNIPIILLPLAATDQVRPGVSITATVASVSSIATLGGAFGKFVNGFVCQRWGSYTCSKLYLVGMALYSFLFSMAKNPTTLGLAYSGMEFFASIQWTSLAIMLTNYYSRSKPTRLAVALTAIGLASPAGAIAAKTGGAALASHYHWRIVARIGSVIALLGSFIITQAPMKNFQKEELGRSLRRASSKPMGSWIFSAKDAAKDILTSKLFWMLAVAHSMAFVNRGIDRILGTFFYEMTGLPRALSGGLTLSTTFGLLYGLVSASRKFPDLNMDGQKKFLTKRYSINVVATAGLGAIASIVASGTLTAASKSGQAAIAAALALCSSILSANVAFQFYQFPTMIAKSFPEHKEVCISWLDAVGFLLSTPVWAATAQIVPKYGWASGWSVLTVLFGGAWTLMMKALPPVLAKENESIGASADPAA